MRSVELSLAQRSGPWMVVVVASVARVVVNRMMVSDDGGQRAGVLWMSSELWTDEGIPGRWNSMFKDVGVG